MKSLITIVAMLFVGQGVVYAHPGRTDANGGHHDRKNGGYHYHNSGTRSRPKAATPSYTPKPAAARPTYTPPVKKRSYNTPTRPVHRSDPPLVDSLIDDFEIFEQKPEFQEPKVERTTRFHNWRDTNGHIIKRAEFYYTKDGTLHVFEPKGHRAELPLRDLSEADRALALTFANKDSEFHSTGHHFTTADGKYETTAQVLRSNDTHVRLRRIDGKVVIVKQVQLAETDRRYIHRLQAAIKPPKPVAKKPKKEERSKVAASLPRSLE